MYLIVELYSSDVIIMSSQIILALFSCIVPNFYLAIVSTANKKGLSVMEAYCSNRT